MDITAAIRAELAYRNMTLTDLSDKTGMSRKGLSQRMNGHTPFRLNETESIANALDVDLATLIIRANGNRQDHAQKMTA